MRETRTLRSMRRGLETWRIVPTRQPPNLPLDAVGGDKEMRRDRSACTLTVLTTWHSALDRASTTPFAVRIDWASPPRWDATAESCGLKAPRLYPEAESAPMLVPGLGCGTMWSPRDW